MRKPVTIVGGFLGSGKTTLVNELLRGAHGLKLAVIVNEFGDVGIDGKLVPGGEQFVELDNGCLCCALNEDLDKLVRELAERGGFDHLVIETTGLADPLPVAWTFSRPGLASAYRVDAIVTMVDALNIHRATSEAPEAFVQLERADVLVMNKCDLAKDALEAAKTFVREKNPHAVMLEATRAKVPLDLLLGVELHKPQEPGHSHHHPSFESWSFQTDRVLDDSKLEDFFYELPEAVYRVKGIVHTTAEWGVSVVHAVAGRFEVSPYDGDVPPRSQLVFIGKDLPTAELDAECQKFLT